MKSSSRAATAVVGTVSAVLALTLSACGGDPGNAGEIPRRAAADLTAAPADQVTTKPSSEAKIVAITMDGRTIEPTALRMELELGQPLVLQIDASEAGQLHVHSTPEQVVAFPAGRSEITLTFDAPGVIAIEDHALDLLIVQLEVS